MMPAPTLPHAEALPDPACVLVVLPALNEERHIEACIRSLMMPADWMLKTTMVVADGGSTDATPQIVLRLCEEFPNLHLSDNPERLQSAGVNEAVRQFASFGRSILVRCDVHAIYPVGYVRDVSATLRTRAAASVATVMDAVGDRPLQRAAAWIVDTPLGSGGAAHRSGQHSGYVDHGHHAGFDLDWFRLIGGYDPAFSHNEDAEYDIRLGEAGGRIWLAADIRLRYLMRPTLRGLARQYWSYGRGRARTLLKHRVRPKVRQLVPVLNLGALVLSVLLGLVWPPAFAWLALYLAVLVGASIAGAVRLRSVAGLLAGAALLAMHLAWALGFTRQLAFAATRQRRLRVSQQQS